MKERQAVLFCFFLFICSHAYTQQRSHSFYVVVGAFAIKENAERFTSFMHNANYPATYEYNPQRKLYYVYTMHTNDKSAALALVYRLRQEEQLEKTWIFDGAFASGQDVASALVDHAIEKPSSASLQNPTHQSTAVESQEVPAEASVSTTDLELHKVTTSQPQITKPLGKPFQFKLVDAKTSKEITGSIIIMESEKDTTFQTYQGNEIVYVPSPKNTGGKMVILCNLIGYKSFKKAINYNTIVKDKSTAGEEIVIPIKLTAAQKGDYLELQNVTFFEQSAILKPESEQELIELVNLMSNPRYKISIQSHTHEGDKADFTILGESTDYFTLSSSNQTIHGSVKDLSRYRAEIVKSYLVSKGVAANRISTKGLGSMLAIYEHAAGNDRIEVEILKD